MIKHRVSKEYSFDAAHQLVNHEGQCKNLHGHTYKVIVTVEGEVDPKQRMVVDFHDMDKVVKPMIDRLDHSHLNDIQTLHEAPTAEMLATHIASYIQMELPQQLPGDVRLYSVRVYETPKCYAEVVVE